MNEERTVVAKTIDYQEVTGNHAEKIKKRKQILEKISVILDQLDEYIEQQTDPEYQEKFIEEFKE